MNTGILIAIYRLLLRLFPHSFRSEFEEQMLLDFSDLVVDAKQQGKFTLVVFLLGELVDFPVNLLRIHQRESRMFKMFHSKPVRFGLRGALGFGVVFALAIPSLTIAYETMFPWLYPIVTDLQAYFYDHFHVEQQFALIAWIPSAFSHLVLGLVMGSIFALVFAERSRASHYVLVSMLGWFLYGFVTDTFSSFNFEVFLEETQLSYFYYMIKAFVGAIFGLIFIAAESNRRGAVRLLVAGIFIFPLLTYLSFEQLFELLVFRSAWRIVGVVLLMVILIASVLLIGLQLDDKRKVRNVLLTATLGYPAIWLLMTFVYQIIYSPVASGAAVDTSNIALSNAVFGIVFGLLLGVVLGVQKTKSMEQTAMV